jgi:hypothetical protein
MKRVEVKQEYGSWDFREDLNFVNVKSKIDNLEYKIYDTKGQPPIQEKKLNGKECLFLLPATTPDSLKLQLADILAKVRQDITKMLIYIYLHSELWINDKIKSGILHTLDIHIPCWRTAMPKFAKENKEKAARLITDECLKTGTLFNYQEMPRNEGILGLNKPKFIYGIVFNGKVLELCSVRAIFLTLRDYRTNRIKDYEDILDLALHELTHTTCNDCRWKPDNHLPPYKEFRTKINSFARSAGLQFEKK